MRTKGRKKAVGGFAPRKREGPSGGTAPKFRGATKDKNAGEGKAEGKRPAVAARKEKLKGKKQEKC